MMALGTHRFVLFIASMGVLIGLTYPLLSGSPTVEASETTTKAMVSILAFNSSQQVLYDYADSMDFTGIEALADANPSNSIPQQDLLGKLPGPLPGWGYLIWGDSYTSNSTDANALGMYSRGTMPALEEIAYITISHRVGGFEYSLDPMAIQGILGVDDGYPKDVTVQGYLGIEWRSTGENLGEIANFEGNLESFSGLWVRLGGTTPIPEAGLLVLTVPLLLLGARWRKRTSPLAFKVIHPHTPSLPLIPDTT